jgi:cytochrome c5
VDIVGFCALRRIVYNTARFAGDAGLSEINSSLAGNAGIKEIEMIKSVAASFALASLVVAAPALAEPSMDKYNRSCAACHVSGVAGAPKSHDVAAWESRMSKGMDALVASVKNGLNAMPPTGLCADCTDEEYQELITYMSTAK